MPVSGLIKTLGVY